MTTHHADKEGRLQVGAGSPAGCGVQEWEPAAERRDAASGGRSGCESTPRARPTRKAVHRTLFGGQSGIEHAPCCAESAL